MARKPRQRSSQAPEITPAPLPRLHDQQVPVRFLRPWRHNQCDYAAGDDTRLSPQEFQQLLAAGAVAPVER